MAFSYCCRNVRTTAERRANAAALADSRRYHEDLNHQIEERRVKREFLLEQDLLYFEDALSLGFSIPHFSHKERPLERCSSVGPVRAKRNLRNLPNGWDDINRCVQRSWKLHRRTQYRTMKK